MTSKNLDERSFVLGLETGELPLEPEQLDRVAYNKGLQIYHSKEDFKNFYGISIRNIGFFITAKDNGKDISKILDEESFDFSINLLTKKYNSFLELVKSVSQFTKYTKKLEEQVTSDHQHFMEETTNLFK